MDLSAFTVVDHYPAPGRTVADRLREVVDLGHVADRAGLSNLWVAEHHFHEGGVCPQPAVLLAAVAERTHRLGLGVLVSVLPFHGAIDVAEQYAMVDQLSGGRLRFGVGSGYLPLELDGFGVDPATKRDRFERTLHDVMEAFEGRPIPSAGAPVVLNVRPTQQPHPPVTFAVQRTEAIPHVGRRGVGLALIPYATVSSIDELRTQIASYRAALPPGVPGRVAIGLHLAVTDDPREARAALQRYIDTRLAHRSTSLAAKVAADPAHAQAATIEANGFAVFGPVDEVVARLEAFRAIGVDEILGLFDFGGLPPERWRVSVEALGAAWSGGPGARPTSGGPA